MKNLILNATFLTTVLICSCGNSSNKESTSKKDSDDSAKEVVIGKQIWMTENLNVNTFRNGDTIPQAKSSKEWDDACKNSQPAWCYYNNNPDNGAIYGKLYNCFAVNDPRGMAPGGWSIPTVDDWHRMVDFLGGSDPDKASNSMKSKEIWHANNKTARSNPTNESGFSAYPGGNRRSDGVFDDINEQAYWWSSSVEEDGCAWVINLLEYSTNVSFDKLQYHGCEYYGFSVRCFKNLDGENK